VLTQDTTLDQDPHDTLRGGHMDDGEIIGRIDQLIAEEHALRARAVGQGLSEQERQRLEQLEARLDQCWDLLRQRRARAEFGEDPDEAQARPISEVEGYRQ
jgi:Rad3-related DNA helicase